MTRQKSKEKSWKMKLLVWMICIFGMCCTENKQVLADSLTTGDGYEYILLFGGGIEITGYIGSETELVIPETINNQSVIMIGETAFSDNNNLVSVKIPNGVQSISLDAFNGCSKLMRIELPESLKSIGESAFEDCSSLTSIEIPDGVTDIEFGTFKNCVSLINIEIPKSVEFVSPYAFRGCSNLTNIEVDNENTTYDSRENCNAIIETATNKIIIGAKETKILDGITSIGDSAFEGRNGMTSIEMSDSVTQIGYGSFKNCTGLADIELPGSLLSIGSNAFEGCTGLVNVELPEGLKSIGEYAFSGCAGLKNIEFPDSLVSIEYGAFSGCDELTSVVIPAGVTAIGSGSFSACDKLVVDSNNTVYDSRDNCNAIIETASNTVSIGCKETKIPTSVTNIGNGAFGECTGLTNIEIPNSVTKIGNGAFSGCTGLTSMQIPNSVTKIGDSAFAFCENLKSINIPNSVTEIESCAFRGCSSLTNIEIPNSITSLEWNVFAWCNGLTSVVIPNSVTEINSGAFEGCPSKMIIYAYAGSYAADYATNNGYTLVLLNHEHTFDAGTITQQPTATAEGVKTYICTECGETKTEPIPKLVETPDQPGTPDQPNTPDQPGTPDHPSAPDQPGTSDQPSTPNQPSTPDQPSTDNDLVEVGTSINVSGVVYKITKCSNKAKEVEYVEPVSSKKTSVTIPATVKINKETYKVTAVSANAFKNNKKLKSVTIGKNVTKLGKNAFSGCKNLKKITIKSTNLKSVGNNALKGIDKKATIKVPKKQYNKYKKLFKSKTGYKKSMKIKK